MPHPELAELQQLIEWTVASLKRGGQLSDDSLQALHALLPDTLIIAALDLIDRGRVFKYTTSWGRSFYQVFGSTARYSVSVELPCPTSAYCSCPSFSFGVILSDNQGMCKHVLAVQMARRLGKCIEKTITQDELVAIVCPDMQAADDTGNA